MIKMFESVADLKESGYLFRITDNGGATFDRFTVIYCDGTYLGSSCDPFHPQGFGQNGEDIDLQGVDNRIETGEERDLRWIDLPERVRECVLDGINQGFTDYLEAAPAAASREVARDWQGLWNDYPANETPIYRDGDSFYIRDDERDAEEGKPAAGPFATFAEAVRYMLPRDYDLSGPEYHTTVDLWDESGGPAPLWDCEEEPPLPYEAMVCKINDSDPGDHYINLGNARDLDHARELCDDWKAENPDAAALYASAYLHKNQRTILRF
jgi:hypothetical protein